MKLIRLLTKVSLMERNILESEGKDLEKIRTLGELKMNLSHCKELLEKWRNNKRKSNKSDVQNKSINTKVNGSATPQVNAVPKVNTIVKPKLKKGTFWIDKILSHKDKGKTYLFEVLHSNQGKQTKRWIKEGQIANKELVADYIISNKIKD